MDELVKLVSQKTGMSEEMSKVAVNTVLDYLKKNLPAPIAAQVDSAVSGSQLGDLTKGLGGLFGNK
jgi:hypothetical protein